MPFVHDGLCAHVQCISQAHQLLVAGDVVGCYWWLTMWLVPALPPPALSHLPWDGISLLQPTASLGRAAGPAVVVTNSYRWLLL